MNADVFHVCCLIHLKKPFQILERDNLFNVHNWLEGNGEFVVHFTRVDIYISWRMPV